jgi:diguanylate cyclase (GGDEF)-like protein
VSLRSLAPPRLAAIVGPVCLAGVAVVTAALTSFATTTHSGTALAGLAALLAATSLAERYPVPIDGVDTGGVTVSFVFGIATIVLFGWAAGVLIMFAAPLIMQLLDRRPPVRVVYNASVYALAAGSGGFFAALIESGSVMALSVKVGISALTYHVVNVLLVSAVVSLSARRRFPELARSSLRWTVLPFALMASTALMLVVLWQRSPFLTAALLGPLLAIALYQRSAFRELRAVRLALTDPLTALGNHRHFHDRLERELVDARSREATLTLCLLDIDDFKLINDRFGHPVGDTVLVAVAGTLRQNGEAFRLGGDEFALLLRGRDEAASVETAEAILHRIRDVHVDEVGGVSASAGLAMFPVHGVGRDELIRLADSALYWAKEQGKNCVRVSRAGVIELAELTRVTANVDRAVRFRAAAALARAADARDATSSHSQRVADLAVRIARRMGIDADELELTRLAARLHDVGKLAIPEEILRKSGPLTEPERLALERHPQIGYRMLENLGIAVVAESVLRHHERWDGGGYPSGLPGAEIPLSARIIFVADAYDVMTSERVYRRRLTPEEALAELERCSGSQFDPEVVSSLADELAPADTAPADTALAS